MYFATYAVLQPLQAKVEQIKKYKQKVRTKALFNPIYEAMVETMDAAVGRILKALERCHLLEHTFIIFTPDNGVCIKCQGNGLYVLAKGHFMREAFVALL